MYDDENDDDLTPEQRELRDRLLGQVDEASFPESLPGPQIGEITMAPPRAPLLPSEAGSAPLPPAPAGAPTLDPQHEADAAATGSGMTDDRHERTTRALTTLAQETAGGLGTPRPDAERMTHDALRVPEAARPTRTTARLQPTHGGAGSNDERLRNSRLIDSLSRSFGQIGLGVAEGMAGPRGLPDRQALLSQLSSLGGSEESARADIAAEQRRKEAGEERGAQQRVLDERSQRDARAEEVAAAERERIARTRDPQSPESQRATAQMGALAPDLAGQEFTAEEAAQLRPGVVNAREQRVAAEASQRARAEEGERDRDAAMERTRAGIEGRLRLWHEQHPNAGAGGAGAAQAHADLVQIATDAGIPEEAARGMRPRDLANLVAREASQERVQTHRVREAHGVTDGRIPILTDDRGAVVVGSTNLALTEPEQRAMRSTLQSSRSTWQAFGVLERVGHAATVGPLDPRLRSQLEGVRSTLLANLGHIQNFGVLSDSEKERILSSIPNPENARQWALSDGPRLLAGWREQLRENARAGMGSMSIPDSEQTAGLRFIESGHVPQAARGGGARGPGAAAPNGVRMSNGTTTRMVRPEMVAEARRRGYREAPQ